MAFPLHGERRYGIGHRPGTGQQQPSHPQHPRCALRLWSAEWPQPRPPWPDRQPIHAYRRICSRSPQLPATLTCHIRPTRRLSVIRRLPAGASAAASQRAWAGLRPWPRALIHTVLAQADALSRNKEKSTALRLFMASALRGRHWPLAKPAGNGTPCSGLPAPVAQTVGITPSPA